VSFTPQRMAQAYLALYERLLSRHAKPLAEETGPVVES